MGYKKFFVPRNILWLVIGFNLILGLFIFADFGRSTDESNDSKRSQFAYEIYSGEYSGSIAEGYDALGLAKYYGTSSGVLVRFVEQILFPQSDTASQGAVHYFYFAFFQLAVAGMFFLANQFFNEWTSLGAAVLFETQPLLFGHAFINPKDIPLLVVFLATVILGFSMVDHWQFGDNGQSAEKKNATIGLFLAALLAVFFLFLFQNSLLQLTLKLVERAYAAKGAGILGKLFAAFTTAGSLEGYLALAEQYFWRVFRWLILGSPLLLAVLFYRAGRKRLSGGTIDVRMLLAAAVWGFALSTRVFAFAAGGLVGLYGLFKWKQRAILPLSIYTIAAAIFSYISWPFLWVEGFPGLIESMTVFKDYPWGGQVLFGGQIYAQNAIPAGYIPKLMLLQFTEPLVILALAGFLLGGYRLYKKQLPASKLGLLYGWFFLPVIYTIFGSPTLYSNFRQFFFVTPPLFIFAGFSIQSINTALKKRVLQAAFLFLVLLPGVFQMIRLHAYEYMYYNSFVGGVQGAAGKYDLDYWNLAYKEAMGFINAEAPAGSHILVWKNNQLGEMYAKKEFSFKAHTAVPQSEYGDYDYAILPIVWHADISQFDVYPVVYIVEVDGVDLVEVVRITEPTTP